MATTIKSGYRESTDNELFKAMSQGDNSAYEAFYQKYHGPLLTFVNKILWDRPTSEDIVQSTFLRLLNQKRRYEEIDSPRTWLYTIAYNTAIMENRRKSRRQYVPAIDHYDPENSGIELEDPNPLQDDIVAVSDLSSIVELLVKELPIEFRRPVELRLNEGLSYDNIARILNVPEGTVKSRINRGRLRIRKSLEEKGYV